MPELNKLFLIYTYITYIPFTLYPQTRDISDILSWYPFYKNDLAMRNTVHVTMWYAHRGAVGSQSIWAMSAVNSFVAFSNIHGRKREEKGRRLLFSHGHLTRQKIKVLLLYLGSHNSVIIQYMYNNI
jgi:hypothetical protein